MGFEPDSKRPRISLESTEVKLQCVEENLKTEETNCDISGVIQNENSEYKVEESSSLTCTNQHVKRDEKRELEEIPGENKDTPTTESSSGKPGILKSVSASEEDVGIVEFVSNLPGFRGVLKQRYTDFIVSERDLQGNLVRLTDVSVPQNEKGKEFHLDILSAEEKEKIQEVVDDKEKKKSVTLSPDDNKDHRRLVHRAIRENFSFLGKLYSILCWAELKGNISKQPRTLI